MLLILAPLVLLAEEVKPLYFNVVLEAEHLTVIYSQVTSPVLKVHKKMGDSFDKDELVVELDHKVFESNVAKAAAAVIKFQTELEAKKRLYNDDALSQFELDEAVAQLAGAEADFVLAQKMLEDTSIKAPYDGRVVKISMKEYELAQTGKEILTLVDDAVLYGKFLVPSQYMSCLQIGAPVDIYLRETGSKVEAVLSRISPVIDPASSTILVEAKIDNQNHELNAGMTGRIHLRGCLKSAKKE